MDLTNSNLSSFDLTGKRVLLRVDFNIPIRDDEILNDERMVRALPTIEYLLEHAESLRIITHRGRPQESGKIQPEFSVKPIAKRLSQLLDIPIPIANSLEDLDQAAKIVMLENIRFFNGEKNNSEELAKQLGKSSDIYIMDAFGTAHRKQASTYEAIIQSKESCAGFLLKNEVEALNKSLQNPPKPNLAIIGGAKVSSKLGLINNLKDKTDFIIVGGGITNTFLKASGYEVGSSLVEDSMLDIAKEILESGKVLLPSRVIVSSTFEGSNIAEKNIDEISANEMILDQALTEDMKEAIKKSKLILWNGPLGVFENELFSKGTRDLSKHISESQGLSIAGGGETLSAINTFINKDDVSYCSTGGGAFLEFMEGKKLPSIEALESKYLD